MKDKKAMWVSSARLRHHPSQLDRRWSCQDWGDAEGSHVSSKEEQTLGRASYPRGSLVLPLGWFKKQTLEAGASRRGQEQSFPTVICPWYARKWFVWPSMLQVKSWSYREGVKHQVQRSPVSSGFFLLYKFLPCRAYHVELCFQPLQKCFCCLQSEMLVLIRILLNKTLSCAVCT